MTPEEITAIADELADRLSVRTLPAEVIRSLAPNQSMNPYMLSYPDYLSLRLEKSADNSVLMLEWYFNGNVVARHRFDARERSDG